MTRFSKALVALACGMSACIAAGPDVLQPIAPQEPTDALLAAVDARVGEPSAGAAAVMRAWRWRPEANREVKVWLTCRGRGSGRACVVAAGQLGADGAVQVLRTELTGWALANVSALPDRAQLLLQGEDGRGLWRQLFYWAPDRGGEVTLSRRMYEDGW